MALNQQRNWDISMAENLLAVRTRAAQAKQKTVLQTQEITLKAYTGPPIHLPDEILINILDIVRTYQEFQQTFASCCLLSHQWYNATVPYLYERPQLYGKNFEPFSRTICPSINLHVRKSPLSNLVHELDLGRLVHQASKSTTARLLGRTKASLESFRAPQASFAINCLPALARCTNLRSLDLSLVSESPPLPALLRSISHLDRLRAFRLPRSAGFGSYTGQEPFVWPTALEDLAISGGIDAWFLAGVIKFPDTLRNLAIEHCPSTNKILIINFLVNSARKLPNLQSMKISHMPRLGSTTMDDLLAILPHISKLSIAVDYITAALFDNGSHYKSILIDALEREGSPMSPKVRHDNLQILELTNSGAQGVEEKITPIDILIAVDDDSLPALRIVRVAKSLYWQSGETARDAEALSDALQARNKIDWEEKKGQFEHMSEEKWKATDPAKTAGSLFAIFTPVVSARFPQHLCAPHLSDTSSRKQAAMSEHEFNTQNNFEAHDETSTEPADTEAEIPAEVIDPRAGNEEYAAAVAAQGWNEQIPYDYNSVTAGTDGAEWAGISARYEWQDDYGDVAPRIPELEAQLFENEFRTRAGDNFEALAEFECDIQGPERLNPIRSFADAGLHPVLLENLQLCGYVQPTPIQSYCIPYGLKNHDMVAVAQTGSGKTAAYMIPVMSKLMGKALRLCGPKPNTMAPDYDARTHRVRAEPLVVIVVPARELAIQIFDEARRMCYRSMLRPCVSYGGLPYPDTIQDLGKGCDILIATPGRLTDLMDKPDILSMRRVKYTIVDEADELLDNSWEEQLNKILSGGDTNRDGNTNYMLFSATFPRRAMELANEYLEEGYFKITIGRAGSTHRNIVQDVIQVDQNQKQTALWDFIMAQKPCRILIFCNSRRTVDMVDDFLYNRNLPVTSIHSQRAQREREDALRAFRAGLVPVMVSTGVSARGWDVAGIHHVINYDAPSTLYGGIDEYIHRIGRTARIGHTGMATTFFTERDNDLAPALVNVLIESGCTVPDFLQEFVAADGKAHFDEEDGTAGQEITDDDAPGWDQDANNDTTNDDAGVLVNNMAAAHI